MPRKTFLEKYCKLYDMTAGQVRNLTAALDIQGVSGCELRDRKMFIDAVHGMTPKQLADKYHVSPATVSRVTHSIGRMLYHSWREDVMRSSYNKIKSVEDFANMANVSVELVQELVDAPENFRRLVDEKLHARFRKRLQGSICGEDIIDMKLCNYFSAMVGELHNAERVVLPWNYELGDRWTEEAKNRGVTEEELREAAATLPLWTKNERTVFFAYCDGRTAREAVEAVGLPYSYLVSELKGARVRISDHLGMLYPNKQINKVTWRFDRSYLLNCMQDTTHPLGGK